MPVSRAAVSLSAVSSEETAGADSSVDWFKISVSCTLADLVGYSRLPALSQVTCVSPALSLMALIAFLPLCTMLSSQHSGFPQSAPTSSSSFRTSSVYPPGALTFGSTSVVTLAPKGDESISLVGDLAEGSEQAAEVVDRRRILLETA